MGVEPKLVRDQLRILPVHAKMAPYDGGMRFVADFDLRIDARYLGLESEAKQGGISSSLDVLRLGVGDTVEDGITGFLASQNEAAFAAKLTLLCLDRDLRHKMGAAARQASERYAIERTTKIMLAHYERLVSEAIPRRRSLSSRLRGLVERLRE